MDLYRFGLKVELDAESSRFEMRELIPLFHGWIQRQVVPGHLLIDVHDYSHVPQGPGILLVAHEGNISLDEGGGRRGLFYYRKRPLPESVDPLRAVFETAFQVCRLLEEEPVLQARIRFNTGHLQLIANDRLLAPNTDATYRQIEPNLADLLASLQETGFELRRQADPKERFSVEIRGRALELPQLLERF